MKLKFLGIGSAFTKELGNNSAYFTDKDTLYLIDCGETVFSRVRDMLCEFKNIKVIITHLHSDHIGSLSTLIMYCYYKLKVVPTVVFPVSIDLFVLLKITGVESNMVNVVGTDSRFTPFPVRHVDNLDCYGYLIDKEIYYSGDSVEIPEQILEMINSGEIKEIYQDCSILDYDGMVHMPLKKLKDIIKDEFKSRVYLMHLDTLDFENYTDSGFNICEIDK